MKTDDLAESMVLENLLPAIEFYLVKDSDKVMYSEIIKPKYSDFKQDCNVIFNVEKTLAEKPDLAKFWTYNWKRLFSKPYFPGYKSKTLDETIEHIDYIYYDNYNHIVFDVDSSFTVPVKKTKDLLSICNNRKYKLQFIDTILKHLYGRLFSKKILKITCNYKPDFESLCRIDYDSDLIEYKHNKELYEYINKKYLK